MGGQAMVQMRREMDNLFDRFLSDPFGSNLWSTDFDRWRGSPAERAGLQPGDVIVSVNRRRVKSPADFAEAYAQAGETVLVRLYRRGGSLFLVLRK